ncbi:MAG: hypothetical protein IKX67_07270 [Bacteroidales bacterium]|nr:hypothetical protein [Bacteroidales bacterium]
MGILRKGDFVFTEQNIIKKLRWGYMSNPVYAIANLFVFDWESDFLLKTKAGYWYEVEVKISRSDFKADRKHKPEKYNILEGRRYGLRPNYFSYCVPEDLLDKVADLIPDYAGIVKVTSWGTVRIARCPRQLHGEKLGDDELKLLEKFYYNYSNLRWKEDHKDEIIRQLRAENQWLRDEYKAATGAPIEDAL